jgi:hypothetical protein
MSEQARDPAVKGLEAALAGLAPAPAALDRDRLMFRAGLASARRPGWPWPCAAGVLGLTAAMLAVLLALRPGPQVEERLVVVEVPVPVEKPSPAPEQKSEQEPLGRETDEPSWRGGPYFQTQEQLLRWGLDGLPVPPPAPPVPVQDGIDRLLTRPDF